MGKTLILIDGHALAFRQYYALERTNMKTSEGVPSWAVYGFFKAIFDLLNNRNLKPDALCVAFDVSHQTFRVEKYAEYKANRQAMPDPMRVQMDLIYEGLQAFNIPIYTKEGYEADDVIGSISKQACELGHKVLILTGDQDSFQLVDKDGCVKVIIPSKGVLTEYTWEKVYEKLGVYPNQVVDYKSLRGDTSDNIPGVKGIGEKTAIKLLAEYGHLENILEACPNMPENNVKKCLCNDLEMAKTSYFLATILRDLDVNFDFNGTKINLPDVAEVTAFLRKMQFYSFLKNIDSILASFDKEAVITEPIQSINTPVQPVTTGQIQLGLFSEAVKAEVNKQELKFESKIITDLDDLDNLVTTLKSKRLFALHTLANNTLNYDIQGIVIAYNDDYSFINGKINKSDNGFITKTFYIPIAHSIEKQLKLQDVLEIIKPILEDNSIHKILHDSKKEYNIWNANNISIESVIFDTLLASYIKDPTRNHSLEVQALENIEHVLTSAVSGNNNENTYIINLPLTEASGCVSDTMVTIFELTKFWSINLDKNEIKLLYDIELPLAKVLAKMEFNGVSIDVDYLKALSDDMASLLNTVEAKIFELAGMSFNVSSPKQVGEVLFEKLDLKSKKKKSKGKYSTSAEVLEELAEEHEIARQILTYRKFAKLKSTYTDALPALISPIDGRIHTTYNQTTTTTGRLSSSNPNLQNIPARTEEGNKIRKAFIPAERENALILSADYSQIELRLLAHVSGDKNLIDAFNSGEDVHTITASKVFEVPITEVTKSMRYKSKAVNFGIVYGQSKYGLAKALGITVSEAETFINKYFETYPKVKQYMENMILKVESQEYVETMLGRKRYLKEEINSSNGMVREFAKRAAINQPMQGSAADLIKLAMIDFDKKLKDLNLKSKLIIQVHDELVVEVYKDELELVKQIIVESMELGQPLSVPLVIDVNVGASWQEL